MHSELIQRARSYAEELFTDKAFSKHVYHNLNHTLDVADAARLIADKCELTGDQKESVVLAAWLHDTGHITGDIGHEKAGAEKAKRLLVEWGADKQKITAVTEAIEATRMPQQPRSIIDMVLCDADLYHLATPQCLEKSEKLRREWYLLRGVQMTDKEWLRSSLKFMEEHQYHTVYGKTILETEKLKNIALIKNKLL